MNVEPWIVTLITAVMSSGVVTAVINHFSTRKGRLTQAFNQLADAQLRMQQELDSLRSENTTIRKTMREAELKDDEKTRYIRELFHWLAKICAVIDPDWLSDNPKPSLPETIRGDIVPQSTNMEES